MVKYYILYAESKIPRIMWEEIIYQQFVDAIPKHFKQRYEMIHAGMKINILNNYQCS